MSQYATVEREGFTVPLIGIPADAVLDECECCHNVFPIRELMLNADGKAYYCLKCNAKPEPNL